MYRRRGNKGMRRYTCLECGRYTMFTKREENRAGRIRCSGCGSARLEMSGLGSEKQADANDAQERAAEQVKKHGTGSILP